MATSIFNITPLEDQKLQKYRDDALKDLSMFFEREWLTEVPKVVVVDNRETINLLYEKETANWLVGWCKGEFIFILNPDKLSTESAHDSAKFDVEKLIRHELCHSFFQKTFGTCNYNWINEGVAIYVAGQLDKFRMPKQFMHFLDNEKIYEEAGGAIKLIVDKFGKAKLFEFIRGQHRLHTKDELSVVFEKVFSEKLTYDFFNKLLVPNL